MGAREGGSGLPRLVVVVKAAAHAVLERLEARVGALVRGVAASEVVERDDVDLAHALKLVADVLGRLKRLDLLELRDRGIDLCARALLLARLAICASRAAKAWRWLTRPGRRLLHARLPDCTG